MSSNKLNVLLCKYRNPTAHFVFYCCELYLIDCCVVGCMSVCKYNIGFFSYTYFLLEALFIKSNWSFVIPVWCYCV
jgi:hypothetical protein